MSNRRRNLFSLLIAACAFAGCYIDLVPFRLDGPRQKNGGTSVVILEGQTYAERGEQTLQFDLYRPTDFATGNKPLVILVHGGSWRSGDRFYMLEWCYDLAAQGYAAATVDYRLARGGVAYPEPVSDVLAAVRFFRDNAVTYGIDPNRVALVGQSAGGHLALLAGLSNDVSVFDVSRPMGESLNVRCVVDLFGPTDFTVDPSTADMDQIERIENFMGATLADAGPLLAQASPITYVRADGPPTLIVHGDADTLVPVDQARRMNAALDAAGQVHEYLEVPGMDHVPGAIWQLEYTQSYRATVLAFLAANL